MGKEKVTDEIMKTTTTTSITEMILKYAPLLIGLIAILACYLLYKKFQSLNNTGDSVGKLEKQFVGFAKDQSDINTVNSKKFNSILSQLNQLSYIIQNSNQREQNSIPSQMSPERELAQSQQASQQTQKQQQQPQPKQREFMPNSIIQTNFPIAKDKLPDEMLKPINTTNKKENLNDQLQQLPIHEVEDTKNKKNKKVVTLTEDVLIEEASSDDE
jgi:hypothetical protein